MYETVADLTAKERRVLAAIDAFRETHGRSPAQRELARHLGLRSQNSVRQYYRALQRKGYLDIAGYRWRGVAVKLPVVAQVACGSPVLAEEDVIGYLTLDAHFLSGPSTQFVVVQARGDSMNRAGIAAGDFLLARRQPTAEAGETVIARIGDEVTVKRFRPHPRGGGILLPQSSNPAHRPIRLAERGAIVAVLRRVFKRGALDRWG